MNTQNRDKSINRIIGISIAANGGLSFLKVLVGMLGRSAALVADGVHSISDISTSIIALAGIRMGEKESDRSHQYGHEKIEAVVTKIIAVILFVTAVFIAWSGIEAVRNGGREAPSLLTAGAALISIVVKEWLYRSTRKTAEEVRSSALLADAWHHRTDAFSSVASFAGILGARLGYPLLDPLMAVFIGLFVMKVAVEIYIQSVRELIDTAADDTLMQGVRKYIEESPDVLRLDVLRSRMHGQRVYVDIEIALDGSLSLRDAHGIAEKIHRSLEEKYPRIKHCMIHVNPA
ncbi:MAG: cation diffusion facilitator family transporter [Fibrobacterota bacterium]